MNDNTSNMSITEAISILNSQLSQNDVSPDIWNAIQICKEKAQIESTPFILEDDIIIMPIQQYCDDCNEQFSNGVNVGRRALMKSTLMKSMYEKGLTDMADEFINMISTKSITKELITSTLDRLKRQNINQQK